MTARFFSTCALILTVMLVRRVLRGRMDPRLTYALWLLVALRVLIPVSLFRLPASVAESTGVAQTVEMFGEVVAPKRYENYELPGGPYSYEDRVRETNVLIRDLESRGVRVFEGGGAWAEPPEQAGDPPRQMVRLRLVVPLWRWVCIGGAVVAAALQVRSNVRFAAELKRRRRPFEGKLPVYCPLEVYIVDDLPSPCMFGFLNSKVYINLKAAESEHLDHILTHEFTHYRHGDQWWALLRCACLCVQWYNPLVRAAARRSREDCEAACDASVIKELGEDQRVSYGRTLVDMIAADAPAALCHTATTMTGDTDSIYRRIGMIAKRPKMTAITAVVAVLVVVLATGRAFGGAAYSLWNDPAPAPASSSEPLSPEEAVAGRAVPLSQEELRWFNEEFFNSKSGRNTEGSSYSEYDGREVWYNIRNQFANPLNFYDRPEDINLHELFYLEGSEPSMEELSQVYGTEVVELPCPAYKFTGAEMDWILYANTGLTLDQTNRTGMEGFLYDPKSDAYFWLHGDTNYPGDLVCVSGTREDVNGESYVSLTLNWGCRVILLDRGEGVYWFVANQKITALAAEPAAAEPVETPCELLLHETIDPVTGSHEDRSFFVYVEEPAGPAGEYQMAGKYHVDAANDYNVDYCVECLFSFGWEEIDKPDPLPSGNILTLQSRYQETSFSCWEQDNLAMLHLGDYIVWLRATPSPHSRHSETDSVYACLLAIAEDAALDAAWYVPLAMSPTEKDITDYAARVAENIKNLPDWHRAKPLDCAALPESSWVTDRYVDGLTSVTFRFGLYLKLEDGNNSYWQGCSPLNRTGDPTWRVECELYPVDKGAYAGWWGWHIGAVACWDGAAEQSAAVPLYVQLGNADRLTFSVPIE